MRWSSLSVALAVTVFVGSGARAQDKPDVTWDPAAKNHYRVGRKAAIDTIVIHTVEGSQSSAVSTFKGGGRRVSAHYVVGKDGSIVQCVADGDTAWHAGKINGRSIGIEHEGFAGKAETWTDELMRSSARLTRWLCDTYGVAIDREHIIGHAEAPGATHWDPGAHFDWDRYLALVRGDGELPRLGPEPLGDGLPIEAPIVRRDGQPLDAPGDGPGGRAIADRGGEEPTIPGLPPVPLLDVVADLLRREPATEAERATHEAGRPPGTTPTTTAPAKRALPRRSGGMTGALDSKVE